MYFHSNFKFKAEFAIWIHVDGVRYKTIYGPIKYNKHKNITNKNITIKQKVMHNRNVALFSYRP